MGRIKLRPDKSHGWPRLSQVSVTEGKRARQLERKRKQAGAVSQPSFTQI